MRKIKVGSNTVIFGTPIPGCEIRAGVRLRDSHSVGITGNSFSGANSVFSADGRSAGITSKPNTTD